MAAERPAAVLPAMCLAAACAMLDAAAAASPVPANGSYLVRLLFVRHGFSCANVPWNACTTNASQLTADGMGSDTYAALVDSLDELLLPREPASMVGMNRSFGIKPRGWPIPGTSKTLDGKADDCLVKVLNDTLVDGQYDEFGNLVAVRQLVRDPHITACDQHRAKAASRALSAWLEREEIVFDLVASSPLKRAIETAQWMFMDTLYGPASKRVQEIAVLPYVSEKNEGTPFQPENYPYPAGEQGKQLEEVLGARMASLSLGLTSGPGAYPGKDQQWDKFKVVLALEVLPALLARRATKGDGPRETLAWTPNPALVGALEQGRAAGEPVIPTRSGWPQVRDQPLDSVKAGPLRYQWQEPIIAGEYEEAKAHGSAPELVIGLGSHGAVMMNYCLEGAGRPNNLAVFEKRMRVNVDTRDGSTVFTVAEQEGPCRIIMDAPSAPVPGTLSRSDLGENCKDPFDVALFMDLAPEPAPGQASRCMSMAHAESFPLMAASALRSPGDRQGAPLAGPSGMRGYMHLYYPCLLLGLLLSGFGAGILRVSRRRQLPSVRGGEVRPLIGD